MKVRLLNKDWQSLVDLAIKIQSKRDSDKPVYRFRRKRLELASLLHKKVEWGKFLA